MKFHRNVRKIGVRPLRSVVARMSLPREGGRQAPAKAEGRSPRRGRPCHAGNGKRQSVRRFVRHGARTVTRRGCRATLQPGAVRLGIDRATMRERLRVYVDNPSGASAAARTRPVTTPMR